MIGDKNQMYRLSTVIITQTVFSLSQRGQTNHRQSSELIFQIAFVESQISTCIWLQNQISRLKMIETVSAPVLIYYDVLTVKVKYTQFKLMNCFACELRFSSDRPPRVLIDCGHTICQSCLTKNYTSNSIRCPECQQLNFGPLEQFPKNLTLLNLQQTNSGCSIHRKPYEGFCEKDKELLCVTCILDQKHRSHKISSIQQTVAKDKEILQVSSEKIKVSIKDLKEVVRRIHLSAQHTDGLIESVNTQVESFYNKLRLALQTKEQQTKSRIESAYRGFMGKLETLQKQANEKIDFLHDLYKMYQETTFLKDIEYLGQSNKRIFIVENSSVKQIKLDIQPPVISFIKTDQARKIQAYIQEIFDNQTKRHQGRTKKCFSTRTQVKKEGVLVLELDLNDKYRKHQQTKNVKKINQGGLSLEIDDKYNYSEIQMKSSQSSCQNQSLDEIFKKDMSLSVRDYDYSLREHDEKVYHLGGFNNTRTEIYDCNMAESYGASFMLERTRFQAVAVSQHEILVIGGNKIDNSLLINIDKMASHPLDFRLNPTRVGFMAITMGDRLYIIGGSDNKSNLNLVEEYSLKSLSSKPKRLPNLIFPRTDFGAIIGHDGKIYVVGGLGNKDVPLMSCQRYDFSRGKWELIANMHSARSHFGLAALPDGIYAIGGSDGSNILCSVQKFDYTSQTWITVASLSQCRINHSVCTTSNYQGILVFGGNKSNALKSIQRYSVLDQRWTHVGDMIHQRYLHQSVILRSVI